MPFPYAARSLHALITAAFLIGCVAPTGAASDSDAGVDVLSGDASTEEIEQAATYGSNGFREVKDATDPRVREWARSVAIVVWRHAVEREWDRSLYFDVESLAGREGLDLPLCRYGSQPVPRWTGASTAFLVAPDIVATAGHVMNTDLPADQHAFVFDFQYVTDASATHRFRRDQVYFGRERIAVVELVGFTEDWALVRLDRPVTGRTPLRVRRSGTARAGEPVVAIGHPWGTPMKFGQGRILIASSANWFEGNWASVRGLSGAPVISRLSGLVEGIHGWGDSHHWVRSTHRGRACYAERNCAEIPSRTPTPCGEAGATSAALFQSRVPR